MPRSGPSVLPEAFAMIEGELNRLLEAEDKFADELRDARRERDEAIKSLRALQMETATEQQEREADEQEQKMEYDRVAQELDACRQMLKQAQAQVASQKASISKLNAQWRAQEENWQGHIARIEEEHDRERVKLQAKIDELMSDQRDYTTYAGATPRRPLRENTHPSTSSATTKRASTSSQVYDSISIDLAKTPAPPKTPAPQKTPRTAGKTPRKPVPPPAPMEPLQLEPLAHPAQPPRPAQPALVDLNALNATQHRRKRPRSPPPPEIPRQPVLIRKVRAVVRAKTEETDSGAEELLRGVGGAYEEEEQEEIPPPKRRSRHVARIASEDEEEQYEAAPPVRKSRTGRSTSRSRPAKSAPPTEDEGDDEDELAPLSEPKFHDPRVRRTPASPPPNAKKRRPPTAKSQTNGVPTKRRAVR
ncbi:hypothetical protein HDZ31DRAFT_65275 [Schizophyllum fasciatum]